MEEIYIKDLDMPVIKVGFGRKTLAVIAGINLSGFEGQGAIINRIYKDYCNEYTIYLLDRRRQIPNSYTTEDMAEDIYKSLKYFAVSESYVLGISHGGMIAQALASMHPEFVCKMVLASTAQKADEQSRILFKSWLEYSKAFDIVALNRSFFNYVYSDEFFHANELAFKGLENVGTQDNCVRFSRLCEAILNFDGTDFSISCPTFVIHSKQDKIFSFESVSAFADSIGAKYYLYDGYAHAVYDEAPDFLGKVFAFFNA